MSPLVAHLNDLGKTEETAGIVDFALRKLGFGGGWRGFTSVGVGSSVLEDSELLLGDWSVADVGIGWGDGSQFPVPSTARCKRSYLAVWARSKRVPQEDDPERPGQPSIGYTIGGYLEELLSRCTMHRVCSAFERQRLPGRPFGTERIAIRTIDRDRGSKGCPPVVIAACWMILESFRKRRARRRPWKSA